MGTACISTKDKNKYIQPVKIHKNPQTTFQTDSLHMTSFNTTIPNSKIQQYSPICLLKSNNSSNEVSFSGNPPYPAQEPVEQLPHTTPEETVINLPHENVTVNDKENCGGALNKSASKSRNGKQAALIQKMRKFQKNKASPIKQEFEVESGINSMHSRKVKHYFKDMANGPSSFQ